MALAMLWHVATLGASLPPQMIVFGHKIPDTDAICAAMTYEWELNERGIPAKAYRLGKLNRETEYVLKSLGLEPPPLLEEPLTKDSTVAIVDTNNPAELPDGVTKANIHSIVDHHKMSGFTNGAPLEVDIRTLCSTGSILYARAKAAARKIPKHIAALMLSCILSDSLEFRSPTTTPDDIKFAKELAEIAGIDLHAHAEAMLDAKAEIGHLAPKDVVMMDSKVYEIGGKKLRISVVETTKPARALEQRQKLVDAQNAIKKDEKLDDVLLFIVDILNESATFLASTSTAADLVEKAWGCTFNAADSTCVLPGVLSRKKQIIPTLEASASKAAEAAATVTPTGVATPAAAA